MSSPVPPEGKFVTADEAMARFEGTFPGNRVTWLKWRISDVENELMGQVKSLRKPLADITTDSAAAGDPGRPERVKTLVIDKVLDLFRRPDGAGSVRSDMDGFVETRAFAQVGGDGSVGVSFTESELARVRLSKARRPRAGTIAVAPPGYTSLC